MKRSILTLMSTSLSIISTAYSMEPHNTIDKDRSRPIACDERIAVNIQHRASNAYLNADEKGENLCISAQTEKPYQQQWFFVPAEDGFFKIRHRGSGRSLDANGTQVYMSETENDWSGNKYQQWSFERMEKDGFFKIRHRQSGNALDADKTVYMSKKENDWSGNHYQQWSFVPTNYKIYTTISDFDYGSCDFLRLLNDSNKHDFVFVTTIENKTSQSSYKDLSCEEEKNLTYSWIFAESNSIRISDNVSVQVNYSPPMALGGIGGGISYNSGIEEVKCVDMRKEHTESRRVKRTENTRFEVPAYTIFNVVNKTTDSSSSTDFKAKAVFKAKADKLNESGRSVDYMVDVSHDLVKKLLEYEGYKTNVIEIDGDNLVFATIRGELNVRFSSTKLTLEENQL